MSSTERNNLPADSKAVSSPEPMFLFKPYRSTNFISILIGLNIGIYIVMVFQDEGFFEFDGLLVLNYGANYGPLTLNGEPWRLFTSIFLHFGLLHLLFNMYALYMIGTVVEVMIGTRRLFIAYIIAGTLASMTSLTFQSNTISAGASGAIFGLYGLFLALLSRKKWFSDKVQTETLTNSLAFIGYNIYLGLKENSGIDNSAHIGGLVSGFIVGMVYYTTLQRASKAQIDNYESSVALLLISVFIAWVWMSFLPKPDRPSNAFLTLSTKVRNNFNRVAELDSLGSIYFNCLDSSEAYRKTLSVTSLDYYLEGTNLIQRIQADQQDTTTYVNRRAFLVQQIVDCKTKMIGNDLTKMASFDSTSSSFPYTNSTYNVRLDSLSKAVHRLDSIANIVGRQTK